MIGIVVTSFDRPRYLRRMLASLAETKLTLPTTVVLVDDGSQQRRTLRLLTEFRLRDARVFKFLRPRVSDCGVHECLRFGWDFLLRECNCQYLTNLDSDALVTSDWLIRLEQLFVEQRKERGPLLATGFNTRNHPVVAWYNDYCLKATCGGINMFFDEPFYREIVRPALQTGWGWDWTVMRAMQSSGYPLVCCRPSVVQHIGERGFNSRPKMYDFADDFPPTQSHWPQRLWRWLHGQRVPTPHAPTSECPEQLMVASDS